jgi:hypothetical protein
MLIICNNAFKFGSSWLHTILVELFTIKKLNSQEVPDRYKNDINCPITIIKIHIEDYLLIEDINLNNQVNFSLLRKVIYRLIFTFRGIISKIE